MSLGINRRILVIDDQESIHADYRSILVTPEDDLADLESDLFGEDEDNGKPEANQPNFEITSALQGKDALDLVIQARDQELPFAMAFVDMRMPPGWDGLETIQRIREVDPQMQFVICSAYADYSWSEVLEKLGITDGLLILKKPFESIEVLQLARAMTSKWNLARSQETREEVLEAKVAQRTEVLATKNQALEETLNQLRETQAQLVQADKMASIGQLAAGVAHEVNNPIGFVFSNLSTLRDYVRDIDGPVRDMRTAVQGIAAGNPPSPEAAQELLKDQEEADLEFVLEDVTTLVEESLEGAQRVREIVGDLRDFSHIDRPDLVDTDLNDLLEKTLNVAHNELKYKAEVSKDFGDLPLIPCYGGKLGQVFLNLLVNAAQAIPEHGEVSVRTTRDEAHAWIEISDTGMGISEENLSKIFDPFFTTKDIGQGTGLGLHLSYKIMQAHGGDVEVESEVGQGTTFRLRLPLSGPSTTEVDETVSNLLEQT